MKTYFGKKYLQLNYDEEKRLGQAIWMGFLKSEEFKEGAKACLDLIEEQQLIYWLADNRKMKAIRQKDQDWFVQEILPRLAQSSLRKMATLISEDIFNQMAVENLQAHANELVFFDNYHFKTEEEARSWLTATALNIPSL